MYYLPTQSGIIEYLLNFVMKAYYGRMQGERKKWATMVDNVNKAHFLRLHGSNKRLLLLVIERPFYVHYT